MKIVKYSSQHSRQELFDLNVEYMHWVFDQVESCYKIEIAPTDEHHELIQQITEDLFDDLETYHVLVLEDEDRLVGMGMLREMYSDICEIKRMYIRPSYRGNGFGSKIFQNLLETAKAEGYKEIRLDTGKFMKSAHSIYYANGFEEIEPYPEAEIPEEFYDIQIFMRKKL